jgi:hypothetical protein
MLTRRDPVLEPIGIALEQGYRRGLGIEQADRGVDDRLQELLLDGALQSAGNNRPPRYRPEGGQRGGEA